jgi:hypothetical protein
MKPVPAPSTTKMRKHFVEEARTLRQGNLARNTKSVAREAGVARQDIGANVLVPYNINRKTLSNGRRIVSIGPITTRKVNVKDGRNVKYVLTPQGWKSMKRGA